LLPSFARASSGHFLIVKLEDHDIRAPILSGRVAYGDFARHSCPRQSGRAAIAVWAELERKPAELAGLMLAPFSWPSGAA
jgi:hypothetical protein